MQFESPNGRTRRNLEKDRGESDAHRTTITYGSLLGSFDRVDRLDDLGEASAGSGSRPFTGRELADAAGCRSVIPGPADRLGEGEVHSGWGCRGCGFGSTGLPRSSSSRKASWKLP